ncbi:YegJ family protein [Labrys monachus]|uniref:Uncharacterized protein YegJ (DUF2314 family) n=1 Tax=Labrys monachus TaxID=217067 RepID=A0ABU0FL73_9HYPH|nr:DUF2314 domain-containing protein [Labrys monachus]MDQ0395350.1 uncharacterized protein YegJ (DUF2314 family) [Labrys monachus]
MKRGHAILTGLAVLWLAAAQGPGAANARHVPRSAEEGGIDVVAPDDPEMLAAISEARHRLAEFVAVLDGRTEDVSSLAVKIPIVDGDNTEYLWVNELSHDGDVFVGTVANDPVVVGNVVLGQRISFGKEQISDWHYVKNGRMRGSFTTCVELSRENPDEARALKLEIGLTCDEGT